MSVFWFKNVWHLQSDNQHLPEAAFFSIHSLKIIFFVEMKKINLITKFLNFFNFFNFLNFLSFKLSVILDSLQGGSMAMGELPLERKKFKPSLTRKNS